MTPLLTQTDPPRSFQDVRRVMAMQPEPYADSEIEALMWQTPLPDTDLPNNGMQLPATEVNDPNQLQLI